MANLTNAAKLARDADFRDRVTAAVITAAKATVMNPQATQYARNYSRVIIQTPEAYADAYAWAMATDAQLSDAGSTSGEITDDLLGRQVLPIWIVMSSQPAPGAA